MFDFQKTKKEQKNIDESCKDEISEVLKAFKERERTEKKRKDEAVNCDTYIVLTFKNNEEKNEWLKHKQIRKQSLKYGFYLNGNNV